MEHGLAADSHRLPPDFSARKAAAGGRGTERPDRAARERERVARRHRLSAQLTVVAAVWSLGLVIAAVALPVDNTTALSPDGTTFVTKTLVAGEGAWVLIPIAVPLVITAVVALALGRGRRRAAPERTRRIAWAAIVVVTGFALFSILSIGGFVLPVAVLLAGATRLSPAAAAPTAPDRARSARRG